MLTLITGASAGLRAEMARQLADLGHDLVLTARRVDRLEELRGEITARHPELRVEVAALDVTDEDQVFEVFRRFAPLERVIVNAGLRHSNIVGTGEHANNLALARTNFVAAATQIEAAMEQFRAQGHGHLVVISSVAAMRGLRGSPAVYAATKRGLGTSQKACAPRCCTQSCRSRSRPSTRGTSEPRRPASRPSTLHRRHPDGRARDRQQHRGPQDDRVRAAIPVDWVGRALWAPRFAVATSIRRSAPNVSHCADLGSRAVRVFRLSLRSAVVRS
jgi:NADP-dependent 3-hydroxy acid dehydrogenase YdfG